MIRRRCTYSCMLFEHTNRTRHKNTRPLFSSVPFLSVGAYSGESWGMPKKNGGIYGRNERRTLHFHSREAQSEPTSRVQRVLKSLRSLLLSYSSERATIFAASRAVSGCVYGCFVSLVPPLCSCILLFYSSFCIAYRSRIDRQQYLCSSSKSYTWQASLAKHYVNHFHYWRFSIM